MLEKFIFSNRYESDIQNIGFGLYYFDKNTLIVGSIGAVCRFFKEFKKPKLMINHTPMERYDAIDFSNDILFQENMMHLSLERTVFEIFENRLEELLDILEKIEAFELFIHLKRKVGSLNKQERELFGFLDLYLSQVSFCIIEEAFLYQEMEMIERCLQIISQNDKVHFILYIPTNKMQTFSLTDNENWTIMNVDNNN